MQSVTCLKCNSAHVRRVTRRVGHEDGGYTWYVCFSCWHCWDGVCDDPCGILPPGVESRGKERKQ